MLCINLSEYWTTLGDLPKIENLELIASYLDRTHPCCSPVPFPSDPYKVYRHRPRVGWHMNENVFEFLHHKLRYICSSFPTTSSHHSLEGKKCLWRFCVEKKICNLSSYLDRTHLCCSHVPFPSEGLPPWAAGGLVH